MAISAPLSIRDHPAIFAPGDLMSARGRAFALPTRIEAQAGLPATARPGRVHSNALHYPTRVCQRPSVLTLRLTIR